MRLARFNIQSAAGGDKRYFVGMPSPAAAAIPAATVYAYPWGLLDYRAALPALAMVLVPALLMVSTIRFRSFKTIDLHVRRSYTILIVIAAALVLITTHPRFVLVGMAYAYLASPFVGMAWPTAAAAPRAESGHLVISSSLVIEQCSAMTND